MSDFSFTDRFDHISGENGMRLELIEKYPGDEVLIPFYYYEIFVGGQAVGAISVRIGDNYHSYYNGHIGYEIEEPFQGHRYSLAALQLVLPVARFHGMTRIYLTCDASNTASRKIIEAAGGRFLEICPIPRDWFAWYEGIEDHRIYQLDL
ncbi:MAG: GNAT family N-acetyltransferase [Oscillospiraceae bacterium]|nr:GNAT family N-acetyltransferase [Oscillospiraceae bacterium]